MQDKITKIFGYFRGTLVSIVKYDKRAYICQLGKLRIIKQNGEIIIGDKTTLWPDVKISCIGNPGNIALLKIGKRGSIGDRTEIHVGKSISIGDDVIISWDCNNP